jgi:hypothetical protein
MIARKTRCLALAAPFLLAAPELSDATEMTMHGGDRGMSARSINVSVAFNSQIPLVDSSEEGIVRAQANARRLFYRLAREECRYLLEEIADSCSLVNLNVNAQIQNYNNNAPLMLNAYSNAGYAITLKP